MDREPPPCPLCGRPLRPEGYVDRHHLVPRSAGGRESFAIHRTCHSKIHSVLDLGELERSFHTWEALREHPEIARFIAWVRKQPPERHLRHRPPRSRRRRR